MVPPDGHVHTEWSWDALVGSMEASCARAVELGVPALAFTDHADLTAWRLRTGEADRFPDHMRARVSPSGVLEPPDLDLPGYLECVRRCRDRFPGLRILSGVELSEPHWHTERARALLAGTDFDRVLGSVHSARSTDGYLIVDNLFDVRPAHVVVRDYLAEVLRLVETSPVFEVLAHIDYPIRYWPREAGPFAPDVFEEEFRAVLRALAASGRVLEVNTRVPLRPEIVGWWREAGGGAVSFGSDAHDPLLVAHRVAEAGAMVEAYGFRPARDPGGFWTRGAEGLSGSGTPPAAAPGRRPAAPRTRASAR